MGGGQAEEPRLPSRPRGNAKPWPDGPDLLWVRKDNGPQWPSAGTAHGDFDALEGLRSPPPPGFFLGGKWGMSPRPLLGREVALPPPPPPALLEEPRGPPQPPPPDPDCGPNGFVTGRSYSMVTSWFYRPSLHHPVAFLSFKRRPDDPPPLPLPQTRGWQDKRSRPQRPVNSGGAHTRMQLLSQPPVTATVRIAALAQAVVVGDDLLGCVVVSSRTKIFFTTSNFF